LLLFDRVSPLSRVRSVCCHHDDDRKRPIKKTMVTVKSEVGYAEMKNKVHATKRPTKKKVSQEVPQ
jgi:hypothetical protein